MFQIDNQCDTCKQDRIALTSLCFVLGIYILFKIDDQCNTCIQDRLALALFSWNTFIVHYLFFGYTLVKLIFEEQRCTCCQYWVQLHSFAFTLPLSCFSVMVIDPCPFHTHFMSKIQSSNQTSYNPYGFNITQLMRERMFQIIQLLYNLANLPQNPIKGGFQSVFCFYSTHV